VFAELSFGSEVLNAAGSLGFAPGTRAGVEMEPLGAFFTNPVSLAARRPAENRCLLPFPGGFLLHTGLPNPGLRAVLRDYAGAWARSSIPVVVALLGSQAEEIKRMVQRLEGLEGVIGVEIGLPPDAAPELAVGLCLAAQGELPVIANLPPKRIGDLGPRLKQAGVGLVSLAAQRGALPGPDGRLMRGRLYGPSQLPAALLAVTEAAGLGLEVIGSGGIYSQTDVAAMRTAGASAVQVDTAWWRGIAL
jgi:dihydroorotate dehydrogenase (NAD+) catalytic subunit